MCILHVGLPGTDLYRIAGNFRKVQIFVNFATHTHPKHESKNRENFNTEPSQMFTRAQNVKIKNAKISSGGTIRLLRKFGLRKISRYTVYNYIIHVYINFGFLHVHVPSTAHKQQFLLPQYMYMCYVSCVYLYIIL